MKFNSLNEVFNFDEEDTFNGLQHVNKVWQVLNKDRKNGQNSQKKANLTKKYRTRVPCATSN